jgi:hypothetical protein
MEFYFILSIAISLFIGYSLITIIKKGKQYTKSDTDAFLDKIISELKKSDLKDKGSTESTLDYLKRDDVRNQFFDYIEWYKPKKLEAYLGSVGGFIILEIQFESQNKKYLLNFWPCTDCACVACNELK